MVLAKSLQCHEKYKNIIFDLCGVMLSWEPSQIVHKTFAAEKEMPFEVLKAMHTSTWLDYDAGRVSREEVIEKLSSSYDKKMFSLFEGRLATHMYPIPEMVEIVEALKQQGYRLYVLSNMPKEIYIELSTLYDIFPLFDGQIVSCYAGCIKPHPQIYDLLLSTYSLKAEECLFIDDREENVRGGNHCGIDGIVHREACQLRAELENRGILTQLAVFP